MGASLRPRTRTFASLQIWSLTLLLGVSACTQVISGKQSEGGDGDDDTSISETGGLSSGGSSNPGSGGLGSGGSDMNQPIGSGGNGTLSSGGSATGSGGDFAGSGGDFAGTGGMSAETAVDPSPGCSKGSASLSVSNAIVGLPDGYDGSTPFPVIFAFHAANNEHTQLQNRFGDTVIGDEHLMIYLDASGSGWNMGTDQPRFNTAMDEVLADGCVDQNRVYALGHSSGAQFIVQLLCSGESRFDAVVPIASSVYCSSWDPVPVLNIHGLNDQERCAYGLDDCDGRKDIVPYTTSNSCGGSTTPADLDVAGCNGGINPGCVEYQDCSEMTFFCNHNDPQYGSSNHGIPCFATSAIDDFLSRL